MLLSWEPEGSPPFFHTTRDTTTSARFTTQGLQFVCRSCKDATTVPYRISNLEQAKAFVQRRRGQARRPDSRPGV